MKRYYTKSLSKINRFTKKNHQGVLAFISPVDFYNIEDLIPILFEKGKNTKSKNIILDTKLIFIN